MTPAEQRYCDRTPKSRSLYLDACRYMPGGTTRTTVYFPPYPLYIARGRGCRVWDADGTERIDFIGNYSALILGHAHPAVVGAISEQLQDGTAFSAANHHEVRLAQVLCARVPSLEMVRFTSSGTEATMFAMRLARVATGRKRIARFEGGYHGTHEYAEVSVHPDLGRAGPARRPLPVPDSAGTPDAVLADTVVLPFNDLEAVESILTPRRNEIAAVIAEPFLGSGGVVPPEPGFLQGLRQLTRELDILLIFDEIISFRLAPGGAQERYGLIPDLTTLAKVIGGGLPAGAFGGRADLMDLLDPRRPGSIPHGGTYNGSPIAMVAGLATLRELTPAVYERLDHQGEWVRGNLQAVFDERGIAAQVSGVGSLFNVHFTSAPIRDHRSVRTADQTLLREFFLGMLEQGILLAPRGMGALSTPMTDQELSALIDAAAHVLDNNPAFTSTAAVAVAIGDVS